MNNVEAGRASTEEGSEERYIFHASLIWSHEARRRWTIRSYLLLQEVGVEYSNQKSTITIKQKKINKKSRAWRFQAHDGWGLQQIHNKKEAFTAGEVQLRKKKKPLWGEFIRRGSPPPSEFRADNEVEQKTLLGMGFTVFPACYLPCVCVSAYTRLCLSGKKLT